jgi:hypothetical protein
VEDSPNIVDLGLGVKGQYKISVVTERGKYYPLGEEWHDNLILDKGLDAVACGFTGGPKATTTADNIIGTKGYEFHGGGKLSNWIGKNAVCMLGKNTTPPVGSHVDLLSKELETQDVVPGSFVASDSAEIQSTSTFWAQCAYAFPPRAEDHTYWELGMRTAGTFNHLNTALFTTNDLNPSSVAYSRIVLSRPLLLLAGQFVEVTFRLSINVPALTTPQVFNFVDPNGTISASCKLVGKIRDLFGSWDVDGNENTDPAPTGLSPYYRGPYVPGMFPNFAHMFHDNTLNGMSPIVQSIFGVPDSFASRTAGAIMVQGVTSFPSFDSTFPGFTRVGKYVHGPRVRLDSTDDCVHIPPIGYNNFYMTASYRFYGDNPVHPSTVNGILFNAACVNNKGLFVLFDSPRIKEPTQFWQIVLKQRAIRL